LLENNNEELWPLIKKVAETPRIKIHFNVDEKWMRVFECDKQELLMALRKNAPKPRARGLLGLGLAFSIN